MNRRGHRPYLPFAAIAILAFLLLASGFGAGGIASAQQAKSYPFVVTMNRVPGATGQVTFMPMGDNQLMVTIDIMGLPPSPSSRAAHIHTAPGAVCDNGAPVTYPLTNVSVDSSGHGTSTSTITLTPDKPILANNAYVNVHEQAMPPGNGVICANITDTYTASGTAAATVTTTTGPTTPPAQGQPVSTGTLGLTVPAPTMPPAPSAAPSGAPAPGPSPSAGPSPAPSGAPAPASNLPGGCKTEYDSWCAYCSTHGEPSICHDPPGYPGSAAIPIQYVGL